jgi:hypothetical protein
LARAASPASIARAAPGASRTCPRRPAYPAASPSTAEGHIGLGPAHRQAKGFRVHPQVAGDMGDRAAGLEHEANGALTQLVGVLPRGSHRGGGSFLQDASSWLGESPSNPARLKPRLHVAKDLDPSEVYLVAPPEVDHPQGE